MDAPSSITCTLKAGSTVVDTASNLVSNGDASEGEFFALAGGVDFPGGNVTLECVPLNDLADWALHDIRIVATRVNNLTPVART